MSENTFVVNDTEDTLYISSHPLSFNDILHSAKNKWGNDIDLECLTIEAENIHTDFTTYDLHDPSDYTNYIVVRYTQQ